MSKSYIHRARQAKRQRELKSGEELRRLHKLFAQVERKRRRRPVQEEGGEDDLWN